MATVPRTPWNVPIVRRKRGRHAHPYNKALEVALTDPGHQPRHRLDVEARVAS